MALAVPLALLTHAADEPAGRIPTLTVTIVALLALGALAGGAVVLLWLRSPLPCRSGLTIVIGVPVLLLAGAYLAWLYVGNGGTLEATTYGTLAAVTTIVAIAILLALSGVTLTSGRWLVVPALLGVVLAGLVGTLTVEGTARAELEEEATQRVLPFTIDGGRAQLILAPGAAGVNHVRLETDRASLPLQAEATMTLALPSRLELGSQTVELSHVSGAAFEHHGAELAVAGGWEVIVTLAEPGHPVVEATVGLSLAPEAAQGMPWPFTDFAGSASILMVVVGIAGLAIGVAAGRSPARMESAGMGIAALALAAILLGQGRLDPILAAGGEGGAGAIDPDDLTLITRGETIYEAQCLSCHGPELRGMARRQPACSCPRPTSRRRTRASMTR